MWGFLITAEKMFKVKLWKYFFCETTTFMTAFLVKLRTFTIVLTLKLWVDVWKCPVSLEHEKAEITTVWTFPVDVFILTFSIRWTRFYPVSLKWRSSCSPCWSSLLQRRGWSGWPRRCRRSWPRTNTGSSSPASGRSPRRQSLPLTQTGEEKQKEAGVAKNTSFRSEFSRFFWFSCFLKATFSLHRLISAEICFLQTGKS